MTDKVPELHHSLIVGLLGAVAFGCWQQSFAAGYFMACAFMLFLFATWKVYA